MPKSDRAEIRRRRNELSCPEAIGEISHIPRGDRDSAATFGGVLDPLPALYAVRLSLTALVSASSPRAVTIFGCAETSRSGRPAALEPMAAFPMGRVRVVNIGKLPQALLAHSSGSRRMKTRSLPKASRPKTGSTCRSREVLRVS